jgi:hypothetical protein
MKRLALQVSTVKKFGIHWSQFGQASRNIKLKLLGESRLFV